jgi:biopolymer transport protein ExbD
MAEKPRFLDVWIVETNTVYREVPFTVVVDWIQQGRLLEDDMLRWSGQADWFPLGTKPIFAAYLPRLDPHRVNDQAEALEPVQVDFSWKHPSGEEDDDVDMIPLIDVSLVLLIFFIMTTTSVLAASSIVMPFAEAGVTMSNPELMWIGFEYGERGEILYSLGFGDDQAETQDQKLISKEELMRRVDARIAEHPSLVGVNIKGGEELPWGIDRWLQDELKKRSVRLILIGVRQKS